MKKIMILLLVFGAALLFVSPVLADDNEDAPGGSLTVTDGATEEETLTFKFSPSVVGQYLTDAASANEQWFAICTYHAGGTNFYGTSSSDTLIYKKDRATGELLTDAAIPATVSAEDGADAVEESSAGAGDGTAAVPSAWAGWTS